MPSAAGGRRHGWRARGEGGQKRGQQMPSGRGLPGCGSAAGASAAMSTARCTEQPSNCSACGWIAGHPAHLRSAGPTCRCPAGMGRCHRGREGTCCMLGTLWSAIRQHALPKQAAGPPTCAPGTAFLFVDSTLKCSTVLHSQVSPRPSPPPTHIQTHHIASTHVAAHPLPLPPLPRTTPSLAGRGTLRASTWRRPPCSSCSAPAPRRAHPAGLRKEGKGRRHVGKNSMGGRRGWQRRRRGTALMLAGAR
jgi:hypothetical protein